MKTQIAALAAATSLAATAAAQAAMPFQLRSSYVGRAYVLDADTFMVGGDKVRLHGIDAVQRWTVCEDDLGRRDKCGPRVTEEVAELIGDREVRCTYVGWQPARVAGELATVYARCGSQNTPDIAQWLIDRGYAIPSSAQSPYRHAAIQACSVREGLWRGAWLDPAIERARRRGADRGPRWIGHRVKVSCVEAVQSPAWPRNAPSPISTAQP